MQVEKNDVNINRLFYFGNKFEINYTKGKKKLTAFIRLVGDAELNRSRTYAIRRSAELRAKLKDKNSDESVAYIASKDVAEKDTMITTVLAISYQTYTREALREAEVPPVPTEPSSDSTLEQQEEYQKQVDAYPVQRNAIISEYVEKKLNAERERLNSISDSDLYDYYQKLVIADICEQEMYKIFREQCAYYGSYVDEKYTTPLFSSFAEFDNLPTDVKAQFVENYSTLDLSSDELKK
jgi:hypothetical protein